MSYPDIYEDGTLLSMCQGLARHISPEPDLADDLTQEAMLYLCQKKDVVGVHPDPRALAYTMARRQMVYVLRRMRQRNSVVAITPLGDTEVQAPSPSTSVDWLIERFPAKYRDMLSKVVDGVSLDSRERKQLQRLREAFKTGKLSPSYI